MSAGEAGLPGPTGAVFGGRMTDSCYLVSRNWPSVLFSTDDAGGDDVVGGG